MPPRDTPSEEIRKIAREEARSVLSERLNSFFMWIILLLVANMGGMGTLMIMLRGIEGKTTDRWTGTMADKAEDWRSALNPNYVKVDIRKIQRDTPVN